MTEISTMDFDGVVILMDWMDHPQEGIPVKGFIGKISVFTDEQALGIKATGHNTANWIARISGPTSSLNIMGCQVRGIYEGDAKQNALYRRLS